MIEIKGGRLTLRTMTREEYHQARRQYVPDPMMDPDPYAYCPAAADEKYDQITARESWYPIVGIFLYSGQVVGELSFKRIDREKGRCEIGIVLSCDAYKGQGYGEEAFRLAVCHAFDGLFLKTVFADTMGSNVRMQRILEKLGFRLIGRLEACYDMRDRWEDRLDYMLLKEDLL